MIRGTARFARSHATGLRWLLLLVSAAVGVGVLGVHQRSGPYRAASFVGGLLLVALAFEFGKLNIRLAARLAPNLALPAAMLSYFSTAVLLALVLASSSPRVVDGSSVAIGLMIGLVIWIAGEIAAAWVVQEHP